MKGVFELGLTMDHGKNRERAFVWWIKSHTFISQDSDGLNNTSPTRATGGKIYCLM